MGYRLEAYNFDELNRLGMPTNVERTLFWAIPVGKWDTHLLDRFWTHFTIGDSNCRDYGLLLLKRNDGQRLNSLSDSPKSETANLSDLLPSVSSPQFTSSGSGTGGAELLVLSGAYPQPGWGLLIDFSKGLDYRSFEQLLCDSLEKMGDIGSNESLQPLRDAADSFKRWVPLSAELPKPDFSKIDAKIEELGNIDHELRTLRDALVDKHFINACSYAHRIGDRLRRVAGAEDIASAIKAVFVDLQPMAHAVHVATIPVDALRSEVLPALKSCLADRVNCQSAFENLSSNAQKQVLRGCLFAAHELNIEPTENAICEWSRRTLEILNDDLLSRVEFCIEQAAKMILSLQDSRQRELRVYEYRRNKRRKERQNARLVFHKSMEKALELQWEIGPSFLVELERACRCASISTKSVSWDPSRMVGWKIHVAGQKYQTLDIRERLLDLAPELANDDVFNVAADDIADGGYFTDFVHCLVTSKIGLAPRQAMQELLEKLMLPSAINKVVNYIAAGTDDLFLTQKAGPSFERVDRMLDRLGWPNDDSNNVKPLAAFVVGNKNGAKSITVKGNDIRISLESFCKDVIDVIVAKLQYSQDQVWTAVRDHAPDYRPASRRQDWNEEIQKITVGPAAMLIKALAPLAFTENQEALECLVASITKCADNLNILSHHSEEKTRNITSVEAGEFISCILDSAQCLLEELPWHLEVSWVYGEAPKVVSGQAWNHGARFPTQRRLLVTSVVQPDSKILFWNPSRRNPVIPDAVFISRPRG